MAEPEAKCHCTGLIHSKGCDHSLGIKENDTEMSDIGHNNVEVRSEKNTFKSKGNEINTKGQPQNDASDSLVNKNSDFGGQIAAATVKVSEDKATAQQGNNADEVKRLKTEITTLQARLTGANRFISHLRAEKEELRKESERLSAARPDSEDGFDRCSHCGSEVEDGRCANRGECGRRMVNSGKVS
jgi:predicted  nucleic acid-binding Zn-ribbon protein